MTSTPSAGQVADTSASSNVQDIPPGRPASTPSLHDWIGLDAYGSPELRGALEPPPQRHRMDTTSVGSNVQEASSQEASKTGASPTGDGAEAGEKLPVPTTSTPKATAPPIPGVPAVDPIQNAWNVSEEARQAWRRRFGDPSAVSQPAASSAQPAAPKELQQTNTQTQQALTSQSQGSPASAPYVANPLAANMMMMPPWMMNDWMQTFMMMQQQFMAQQAMQYGGKGNMPSVQGTVPTV